MERRYLVGQAYILHVSSYVLIDTNNYSYMSVCGTFGPLDLLVKLGTIFSTPNQEYAYDMEDILNDIEMKKEAE